MSASPTQFPFNCNISLEDYSKLWRSSLETQRTHFAAVERVRTVGDISFFLDDLNNLDLMRPNQDISGVAWQVVHPDAAFRKEAAEAQKAFIGFDAEVNTSSALANNLTLYEAMITPAEDDSKRMLQAWKRDLTRGGAYLAPEKKARV